MRNAIRSARKPIKIEITHEEIIADLLYPARESKAMAQRRRRLRGATR